MAFGDSADEDGADERADEVADEGASPPQQTVGWRVLESPPAGGLAGGLVATDELPPHERLPHELARPQTGSPWGSRPASGSTAQLFSSLSSGALTPPRSPRLPTEQQVQFEVDQAA